MAPPKPPPEWLLNIMQKIDPGYFYFVFMFFKSIFDCVNFVSDLVLGYSIYSGSREDRISAQKVRKDERVQSWMISRTKLYHHLKLIEAN